MSVLLNLNQLIRKANSIKLTKSNRKKAVAQINRLRSKYKLEPITVNMSDKMIRGALKIVKEKLNYDVLSYSVNHGEVLRASLAADVLKQSKNKKLNKLGRYGTELAKKKRELDRTLNQSEKLFFETSNAHVHGYGNSDFFSEAERLTERGLRELLENVSEPKEEFLQKKLTMIDRVFQKISDTREEDLDALKELMKNMNVEELEALSNYLLESLTIYDSGNVLIFYMGDKTSVAHARLNDLLKRYGIKPKYYKSEEQSRYDIEKVWKESKIDEEKKEKKDKMRKEKKKE